MKHVVIGTAGHVDHGKTALVRALTGVDTDRLAEEKRRGLTIELGFARLDFPDGSCAGVVDVPGHEKFIKTMLAGAGGIDLAMLVVAADEGFMPQTVEHLNILSLLGVRRGVVVLTKCDLADADWLAMARAELAARVKGTFLENAPVVEHLRRHRARGSKICGKRCTPLCGRRGKKAPASRSACPSTACFRWTASAPSSPARSSRARCTLAARPSCCPPARAAACAICRSTGKIRRSPSPVSAWR